DWVVGLFNREGTHQVRGIDFLRDLGLDGGVANLRDLWSQTDLGAHFGGYSIELAPHESKVIRIENKTMKYEAEFASMIKGTKRGTGNFNQSGLGHVEGFHALGDQVLWAVEVPKKGIYKLTLGYSNASDQAARANVYVDNLKVKEQIVLPGLGKSNVWGQSVLSLPLDQGPNYISIGYGEGALGT